MPQSIPEMLAPTVINAVVSELQVENTQFQNVFGGPFNSRAVDKGGRFFGWDVFNATREAARGRAAGEPHGRRKAQKVDTVTGRFPRVAEGIELKYEEIHNQRRIGGPASEIDKRGADYITRQEAFLKQVYSNHVEMQWAAMLRGKLFFTINGDDLLPVLDEPASGEYETIDFRIPAANKLIGPSFAAGLDPLATGTNIITATWSNSATDIPKQIYGIDEAMTVLSGFRLRHVFCRTSVWINVLNNTAVRSLAGTAVQPFQYVNQGESLGKESFTAVLAGIPWVQWHVCNEVVTVDGSTVRLLPDDYCAFVPEPSAQWYEYWNGSEIVVPWVGMPAFEAYGPYFWAVPKAQPAGYEIMGVHNGIPALTNPYAPMWARVQ